MSIFDSIISEADRKFNLGDKGGNLLSALLGLITDQTKGGLAGFLERFRAAGLGDVADSWVSTGDNLTLSNEQVESALGGDADSIAAQAGVAPEAAKSALGVMIPRVVNQLTPDGTVPDESNLLSRIGGYLTGGAAGAAGVFDRMDGAVGGLNDKTAAFARADDEFEGEADDSILKWLLPLILVLLLVAIGWAFCRKSEAPVVTNANANANKVSVNANANKVSANANMNTAATNANAANTNAAATNTNSERKLTEVSLPNGANLQAYAGGIEDQLLKFIQSDEYKNGTADSLKDKWFNFDDLNFKFGTNELVPESKRQLDNIAAILKAYPDVKIKIGGYTDKKGDDAANLKLSDARAKAVQAALVKAGVAAAQVPEAEGYGEKFATVDEKSDDTARAADRRTAIRLLK